MPGSVGIFLVFFRRPSSGVDAAVESGLVSTCQSSSLLRSGSPLSRSLRARWAGDTYVAPRGIVARVTLRAFQSRFEASSHGFFCDYNGIKLLVLFGSAFA